MCECEVGAIAGYCRSPLEERGSSHDHSEDPPLLSGAFGAYVHVSRAAAGDDRCVAIIRLVNESRQLTPGPCGGSLHLNSESAQDVRSGHQYTQWEKPVFIHICTAGNRGGYGAKRSLDEGDEPAIMTFQQSLAEADPSRT